MSGADAKAALRTRYRGARAALGAPERAQETAATIRVCLELLARLPGRPVLSYLAAGAELDLDGLHQLLWQAGTPLLVPCVAAPGRLAWQRLRAGQGTVPGAHGIRVPDPAISPPEALPAKAVLLVPGVAFAADGGRLGQGGGYYDRLLAGARALSVGVGFACQRCDTLPRADHDRALAGLVLGGVLLRDPLRGAEP